MSGVAPLEAAAEVVRAFAKSFAASSPSSAVDAVNGATTIGLDQVRGSPLSGAQLGVVHSLVALGSFVWGELPKAMARERAHFIETGEHRVDPVYAHGLGQRAGDLVAASIGVVLSPPAALDMAALGSKLGPAVRARVSKDVAGSFDFGGLSALAFEIDRVRAQRAVAHKPPPYSPPRRRPR